MRTIFEKILNDKFPEHNIVLTKTGDLEFDCQDKTEELMIIYFASGVISTLKLIQNENIQD